MSRTSRVPGPRGPTGPTGPPGPSGGSGTSCASRLPAASNAVLPNNQFTATNVGAAGTWTEAIADASGDWTLATTSGIWTYNGGADRRFLVLLASVVIPVTPQAFFAAQAYQGIALNDDLIGQQAVNDYNQGTVCNMLQVGVTDFVPLTSSRIIAPTNGQTVQPVFAREAITSTNLVIQRCTLQIVEIGNAT